MTIPDHLIITLNAEAPDPMRVDRQRDGLVRVTVAEDWSTSLWHEAEPADLIALVEDMASEATGVEFHARI